MTSIFPRNYQQGTCFGYQVCLFCEQDLTYKNCNCELSKLTKNNCTTKVPNVHNMNYRPDKIPITARDFLFCSNKKFGYKLNMNHYYFYHFVQYVIVKLIKMLKKLLKKNKKNQQLYLCSFLQILFHHQILN